ncbi:hypothetical protein [Streptomyces alboflavus]|uniref:hypothetical protein n=1 Tax=Streptomyces alboflavus TaxID=67267 RepID=UPI00068C1A3B|nr:hypothetical protein [Streptomyces alboflavus]
MTPPINLSPGEKVAWNRTAGLTWLWPVGAVLTIAGVVVTVLTGDSTAAYAGIPLGVVLVIVGTVRVNVDASGVSVAPVVAPFVRRRIPLDQIENAWAKRTTLTELHGFGYRIQPGRHAVALRPGDALWLKLKSGREFVVTTDDAASAAGLIEALLRRDEDMRSL